MRCYLALLACVGLLLLAPGLRPPLLEGISAPAALSPLVLFLGCEGLARLVVALPQPAVDPGEIHLADSLRADALWSSYRLSIMCGLLVFVLKAIEADSVAASLIAFGAFAIAGIVPGVLDPRPRWSHLRFRKRLWPELPSNAVVSAATGAPVA